jgi:hypothetical protein
MVGSVHQHRKCRQKSNDKGNFGNSLGKKNRKRILFDTVGAVVMRLLIVLPASSSPSHSSFGLDALTFACPQQLSVTCGLRLGNKDDKMAAEAF